MRTLAGVSLALLTVVALAGCSGSIGDPAPEPSESAVEQGSNGAEVFTPIVGSALAAPLIVPATDGATHLAYELLLTNVLGQPVTIDAVTVEGDGAELLTLAADALTPWIRPLGAAAPDRVLAAGQQAIVTLDVTIPEGSDAPHALTHVLALSPAQAMPPMIEAAMVQDVAPTTVDETAPVVISPPVDGMNWLDGNSCCEVTPHRSAINPINGALYAPERFAIDFVQLDEEGRIFDGAIDDLGSYAFYGADILAVADGPVVSMGWNLPDERPGAHPSGLELAEYGGNHVVQDIGNGRYAFYAHLQGGNPEGLAVGQQLKRGTVIGQLGNSGNTDMPHLHFHVMDSPRPLGSNGLPFLLDSFELVGTLTQAGLMACMESAVPCGVDAGSGGAMQALSPLYRDVMDFGK